MFGSQLQARRKSPCVGPSPTRLWEAPGRSYPALSLGPRDRSLPAPARWEETAGSGRFCTPYLSSGRGGERGLGHLGTSGSCRDAECRGDPKLPISSGPIAAGQREQGADCSDSDFAQWGTEGWRPPIQLRCSPGTWEHLPTIPGATLQLPPLVIINVWWALASSGAPSAPLGWGRPLSC